MTDQTLSRRRLLKRALASLAAVPAAALIAPRVSMAEAVSEADPNAKSLAYLNDATKVNPKLHTNYKPGQNCANCIQYTGKPGAVDGGCPIFGTKTVKAAGWCKVWMLKPGATLG